MGDYSQPMGQDILLRLGLGATPSNLLALKAWAQAEGGAARWNPFNTTQPWQGATDYNSVHVKNYPTQEAGIAATVATLLNGRYGNILAALKQGTDAYGVAHAIADSPWGTGGRVLLVLDSWHTPPTPVTGDTPMTPEQVAALGRIEVALLDPQTGLLARVAKIELHLGIA